MHGQIKIKQSSLLLSQITLSLPQFFPHRRMKELRGMVSGSRPFILKQSSSITLRMISDQASFPLAQSICCHLLINNLIHALFHDLATNHLTFILSSPTEFNCLVTCKLKSLFSSLFHRSSCVSFLKFAEKITWIMT